MTTSKKTCFKCEIEKPVDSFYSHSKMKDMRLNKCKECTKGDVRQHRRDDRYREKVLAYDRLRGNRQSLSYKQQHKKAHENQYKARHAVNNAVRDKRIIKPNRCEHCGIEARLHGHHHDYDKPLSVIWLCVPCHRQIHVFMDLVKKAEQRNESKEEKVS